MTFRVLITSAFFAPGFRGGGPVRSVATILDTVSERIDPVLVTGDRDAGTGHPYPGLSGRWVTRNRARVFYLDVRRPGQWLRLWRELRVVPFDLLYVNSLWSPLFTVLPVVAVRARLLRARDVLIAPRGELAPGALTLKAGKKRAFAAVWRPLLRTMPVRWHASTEREAAEIQAFFPGADVEVSPVQVALPPDPLSPTVGDRVARLVYIGRIAEIKNLTMTLDALRAVGDPVRFDIYGPVEDRAYWARCQASIDRLPPWIEVRHRGPVAADRVRATFAGYDAFVLPTLGESFGHAIAESLSASCPVICSDRTPWTATLTAGGGCAVPIGDPSALVAELRRWAAMTPEERLRARTAAGDAYRDWRARTPDVNILNLVHAR